MAKLIERLTSMMRPHHLPDFRTVRSICLFKTGAIGDVLMTTPLVRTLRARFPQARIDYWVGSWSAPVMKNNPHLDHIIAFDEKHILRRNPLAVHRLAHAIRRQRYDLMFVLDFSYLANVFAAWCRVPIRIGFDRNGGGFPNTLNVPYGKRIYDVDSYLHLARLVGARPRAHQIELVLTASEKKFAQAFFQKEKLLPTTTIGIAPGGARNPGMTLDIKRWPAERFAAVAEALTRKGWRVLLIGGPDDRDAAAVVQQHVPTAINAVGRFPLRRSAALIKQCASLICNDSGPMHLAVAVGTPVIALFGPTDPKKLAPRRQHDRVLWKHPDKMPCYKDGKLMACTDRHACIQRITIQDVLRAVR